MSDTKGDWDAGSRMHVLDWVELKQFIPTLRRFVAPIGFSIGAQTRWQPKGRADYRESDLVGSEDPFLTAENRNKLRDWWLVYKQGATLPTWDLVVSAFDLSNRPALILVEAKAHASELSEFGKSLLARNTDAQQKRTDANHDRIGEAIRDAETALRGTIPSLAISRDRNYQFSNRIAFAWKLASLGVPVALIYLGFIGNSSISHPGDFFDTSNHWRDTFGIHTQQCFPAKMHNRKIDCGDASFWLLLFDLPVGRLSPALAKRRPLNRKPTASS